jgi:hypothetical protein
VLRRNNAFYEINAINAFYAFNAINAINAFYEINEFYALRFSGGVVEVGRCKIEIAESEDQAERNKSARTTGDSWREWRTCGVSAVLSGMIPAAISVE